MQKAFACCVPLFRHQNQYCLSKRLSHFASPFSAMKNNIWEQNYYHARTCWQFLSLRTLNKQLERFQSYGNTGIVVTQFEIYVSVMIWGYVMYHYLHWCDKFCLFIVKLVNSCTSVFKYVLVIHNKSNGSWLSYQLGNIHLDYEVNYRRSQKQANKECNECERIKPHLFSKFLPASHLCFFLLLNSSHDAFCVKRRVKSRHDAFRSSGCCKVTGFICP